ncbi:MAG: dihydrodipicolinate synthase family protein [Pseudomonadota bacterium]
MTHQFRGIYPVLFTFFGPDGEIDEAMIRRQIDICIANGVHGLVLLGFVSQFFKLTLAEKIAVAEICADQIAWRVPFALTLTEMSIEGQKELARTGERLGASWLIAQPAVKFAVPEARFHDYFLEIAAETDLSIAIQNAPDTGVYFSGPFLDGLNKARSTISMIKGEGTTAQSLGAMKGLTDRYTVFSGQHGMDLIVQMEAGAQGAVPAPLLFDAQATIFELVDAGGEQNLTKAESLLSETLLALHYLTSHPNFEHGLPLQKLFFLTRMNLGPDMLFDRHPYVVRSDEAQATVQHLARKWPLLEV